MAHLINEGVEVLKVLCGSRAYGLNDEDSDYDYHGVYVVPTSRILMLGSKIKETAMLLNSEGGGDDYTPWELKHFLEMATTGNPTILETFVAPVEYTTEYGNDIRALFPRVLARKRIFDSFRGYASNQRKKMFEPASDAQRGSPEYVRRQYKAAVAYLRSLEQGAELLHHGTYDPMLQDDALKKFLLKLRKQQGSQAEVIMWAEYLEKNIEVAFLESSIQMEPDMGYINAFLLRVRREMWQ